MLVFASQRYSGSVFPYFRTVVRLHAAAVVVLLLPTVIAFLLMKLVGQHELAAGMLGVGISLWSVLLFYLYRRLCYAIDRVAAAAVSGVTYLVSVLTFAFLLFASGRLDVVSAYVALSVAALAATATLHLLIWPRWSGRTQPAGLRIRQVIDEHFQYGRWSLGASVLIWLPANIYYVLLPRASGLQASGELKALMNLAMPMVQANLALGNVLLASLARLVHEPVALRKHFRRFVAWVTVGCLAYWLLIGFFSEPLVRALYGGKYVDQADLVWYVGLVPLATGLALAERSVYQAILRPDIVFRGNAVGAVIAVVLGVVFVSQFGLMGALLSMLLSYGVMFMWLRRDPRRPAV